MYITMGTDDSEKKPDRPSLANVHATVNLGRDEWLYLVNEKREAEAAIEEAEHFLGDVLKRAGPNINLTASRQLLRDSRMYFSQEDYFSAMRKALECEKKALFTVLAYQIDQNNLQQRQIENAAPEIKIDDLESLVSFIGSHVPEAVLNQYISDRLETNLGMTVEELMEKSKELKTQQERSSRLEQAYILKYREVQVREERLIAREKSLQDKIKILEEASDESEQIEALREIELRQQRSLVGIPHLDEILYGGLPFGSNTLVYGPTHANKEIISNWFLIQGLKMSVPAIVVLTDMDIAQKRQELLKFDANYKKYEEKGLVRYIILSSKRQRRKQKEPEAEHSFEIDKLNPDEFFESFEKIVANFENIYGERHYRLVVEYVTSVDRKLGEKFTEFFKDLTGWVKEDAAVAVHIAETIDINKINELSRGRTIDCMVELDGEKIKVYGLGTLEVKDDKANSYSVKGNKLVPKSIVR